MKKSKIILGIIISIIVILVGLGITYGVLVKKDNDAIEQIKQSLKDKLAISESTYEYGTEITLEDLNLDNDIKAYINNQELNDTYKFMEVGEHTLKVEASQSYQKTFNKEKTITAEKEVKIIVEDTKKPIIEGVADKEITEGDTIDLKQGIIAKDEVDGELEIVIEGEVDTSKAGEYEIKVKATDRNNNTTEATYKVTIIAKHVVVDTTTKAATSTQETNTSNSNGKSTSSSNNSTSTTNKSTNSSNTSSNSSTSNSQTSSSSANSSNSDEPTTYQGTGDGKKYYFEDRGEDGNYGEMFSW
ncbi:MAG: DUF5011 domain-containing protein [Clostridia bacterium]|nr:DUF5011 domain-containing protein [Clostridia bacterium]